SMILLASRRRGRVRFVGGSLCDGELASRRPPRFGARPRPRGVVVDPAARRLELAGEAELLQAADRGRLVLRQELGDAPPPPRLERVVVDEGEGRVVLELAQRLGELLLARRLLDAALAREERVEGVTRGEPLRLARRRLAQPALLRRAVGARLARRGESE